MSEDEEVGEATRRAAEGVKKAGEKFRDVAGDAGRKAGEVFDDAKKHYERASHVIDAGARFTRASTAATAGLLESARLDQGEPRQDGSCHCFAVLGIRGGAAFPGLDTVLLGAHPHWLTYWRCRSMVCGKRVKSLIAT